MNTFRAPRRIATWATVLVSAGCGAGAGSDFVTHEQPAPAAAAPTTPAPAVTPPHEAHAAPDAEIGPTENCGQLLAVIRDFKASHPDMEDGIGSVRGLVQFDLGADFKPVYAPPGPTAVTAGKTHFDQWYRDVAGVNLRVEVPLPLRETKPGTFEFESKAFFPLDGQGFAGETTLGHNFHFTTEVHASFRYRGGEVFRFTGDDDVFVFVNKRLALDLGGVHPAEQATIDFDALRSKLGIEPGHVYRLDIFHAERHTNESNFRVETSIDCLTIL